MANQKLVTCHISSWWIHSFIQRRRRRHRVRPSCMWTHQNDPFAVSIVFVEHNNGSTKPAIRDATHPCMMRLRKLLAKKPRRMAMESLYCDVRWIVRNRQFESSQLLWIFPHSFGSRSASTRIIAANSEKKSTPSHTIETIQYTMSWRASCVRWPLWTCHASPADDAWFSSLGDFFPIIQQSIRMFFSGAIVSARHTN